MDLKAIRERAARDETHFGEEDRAELLALVDRMGLYVAHDAGCPPAAGAACDCGLDALLREIGGS